MGSLGMCTIAQTCSNVQYVFFYYYAKQVVLKKVDYCYQDLGKSMLTT